MDFMQIGTQLLQDKLGLGGGQSGDISSALSGLIGDGDNFDIGSMVSKMQGSGGLASLASSWLGDGANDSISDNQVSELLGSDKIAAFAKKLNIDEGAAKGGLASMLPQLIDKSSSGGSLLDSIGGVGGLMGMASKFMK